MTTTELIALLQSVEHGASGDSREISFRIDGEHIDLYVPDPDISLDSTGDGCAGAQLTLLLETP